MFKCIALVKRREDLSKAEFRAYYENHHAPLTLATFPEIIKYQRNYLDPRNAIQFDETYAIDFDAITELYFENQASFQRFLERSAQPDIAKLIGDDEEKLFDRRATRFFPVEVQTNSSVEK